MRSCALVIALLCSCGAEDGIETTFDPCSPLSLVAGIGTQPDEVRGIEEAIAAWSRVLPTRMDVVTGDPAAEGLRVVFASGDTFYRAIYWDALGEISISREHLQSVDYGIALAHEMGHAFGLFHVPPEDRPSVMNQGNLEIAPTDVDASEVRALWSACAAARPGARSAKHGFRMPRTMGASL